MFRNRLKQTWSAVRPGLPNLIAAHVAGAAGGGLALVIGAPLPWLIGGLIGAATLTAARPDGFGAPWRPAAAFRNIFVVVIGVMIGGAFTPQLIGSVLGWGPSIAGLFLFTIGAQLGIYALYRGFGFDRPTAWFGAAPGGLIENIQLGEEAGADIRRLTLLQFGRIAATVTAVPLLYSIWVGEAVGSAAGETYGEASPLSALDILLLSGAGIIGWAAARRFRIPAGVVVGPVAASGFIHAIGWTDGQVPNWLVALAQLIVGVGVGLRFGGLTPGHMARVLGLSFLSVALMLAFALAIALVAAEWSEAGPATLILAYAPGGIIEMGLIAVSLGASPVFVTAHHVIRVVMAVSITPALFRWISRGA